MTNLTLAPTIFHEDWWLNAAANGDYEVAEVLNGGHVVGRLPYRITRRFGMKWCTQPELTYFLGPAVNEGTGNINTRFMRRLEITCDLLRKLPGVNFMQFRCHRGIQDVIPFQDLGFLTTVQFTHEIHPAPADELWRKIYHKKRRVILRATEKMSSSTLDDPALFMRFYEANLGARGIKNKMNVPTCCRVIEACLARNRGRILAAFDQGKNLAAAIFYVWDNAVSYYMMTTRMLTSDSGTVSALVWQSMQDAAQRQLIFDLGGLSDARSVLFYAAFGGSVSPRYVATKASIPVRVGRELLTLVKTDSASMWS
jgi:Acetyltransferase (GNAT) domain